MAQEAVEKFLGRLITDDHFRKQVKRSFLKTCLENGYIFTSAEQKILQEIDFDSFIPLARHLDRGIKRYATADYTHRAYKLGGKISPWKKPD